MGRKHFDTGVQSLNNSRAHKCVFCYKKFAIGHILSHIRDCCDNFTKADDLTIEQKRIWLVLIYLQINTSNGPEIKIENQLIDFLVCFFLTINAIRYKLYSPLNSFRRVNLTRTTKLEDEILLNIETKDFEIVIPTNISNIIENHYNIILTLESRFRNDKELNKYYTEYSLCWFMPQHLAPHEWLPREDGVYTHY